MGRKLCRLNAVCGINLFLICMILYIMISKETSFLQDYVGLRVEIAAKNLLIQNSFLRWHEKTSGKATSLLDLRMKRKQKMERLQRKLILKQKREKIKEMMAHAWHSYVKYAWGANDLCNVNDENYECLGPYPKHVGASIVDAIDTLMVMGLSKEYAQAKQWIAANYTFTEETVADVTFSVFETTIRLVGGLLSAFAMTGDKMFRDKAQMTANTLLPAFETESGLPAPQILFPMSLSGVDCVNLAEVGSLYLEFAYLSAVTGNQTYVDKVKKVLSAIQETANIHGSVANYLSVVTPQGCARMVTVYTLGGEGDSFYEYLLKAYLLTGDTQAKHLFDTVIGPTLNKTVVSNGSMVYLTKNSRGKQSHVMEHLACFSGGLLAMYSRLLDSPKESRKYLHLATQIADTCHQSYSTKTGFGPSQFFVLNNETISAVSNYQLNPETVETYFYLWRLTGQQKYRDWAWEVVLALEKSCRRPWGYSGLVDVDTPQSYTNEQPSFFLAETLKYLYLIFSDDLFPLENWVFNTEGHPLPVKGRNPAWPLSNTVL